jgi:hypothetical protein
MKRIFMISIILIFSSLVTSFVFGEGYIVTSDLWIKAVIDTEEKGPISAIFYEGGDNITSRGDRVIWGYFYANPTDVTWGNQGNPDLYVKIWFDVSGRIDVNYFHVSVPDITVYSSYPYDGSYDQTGTTTMNNRYIRHEYWQSSEVGNSKFYGTFNLSLTGTQPSSCTSSGTITIGNDYNRLNGTCDYLYIPSSGSSANYSFNNCDNENVTRDITISGDTIHIEETGFCSSLSTTACWTDDYVMTFSSDHNGGSITGTRYDDNATVCQGSMTGNFSEISGDNSKFYGTFDFSVTGTQPSSCERSGSITIGNDYNRISLACDYLYIPSSGTSAKYSFKDCNNDSVTRSITISGDTIHFEETGVCGLSTICWSNDSLMSFSNDHNSGILSGTSYDENANYCQGTMIGSFTKSSSAENP